MSGIAYGVLWIDAVPAGGRSLVLCMATTADGYRHMLACAEGTLHHARVLRLLLQGLLRRGLCADRGLPCITSGASQRTCALTACLGPHRHHPHGPMAKRERVVRFLAEEQRRSVRGAITRAFQLPRRKEAQAARRHLHARWQLSHRSAARWLLRDLDLSLTLHRTGLYEVLSPSLRGTHSLMPISRQLIRQLRDLRPWLPPHQRRAQRALLLLESKLCLRKRAHASQLLKMRSALLAKDGRPRT